MSGLPIPYLKISYRSEREKERKEGERERERGRVALAVTTNFPFPLWFFCGKSEAIVSQVRWYMEDVPKCYATMPMS